MKAGRNRISLLNVAEFDTRYGFKKDNSEYQSIENLGCAAFDLVFQHEMKSFGNETSVCFDRREATYDVKDKSLSIITASTHVSLLLEYWQSIWNRAIFCSHHGYECRIFLIREKEMQGRSTHFVKVKALSRALKLSYFVMWLDIDAFFGTLAFENPVTTKAFLAPLFDDEVQIVFGNWAKPFLNSGLMIMKRSSWVSNLLNEWWSMAHSSHDQTILWHLVFLELQKNREDGTAFEYGRVSQIPTQMKRFHYDVQLLEHCKHHSYTSCIENFYTLWCHFFGRPGQDTCPIIPGKYGKVYVHPGPLDLSLTDFIFHCVNCDKAHKSFVIHMGHTSWGQHSKINASIKVSSRNDA